MLVLLFLAVETASCTEVLKQLMDYKQKQYAEGVASKQKKINNFYRCSVFLQICRQWTMS